MSSPSPSRPIAIGKKKYVCIEYPGYVKNTEKAINTMGGEKKISECLSTEMPVEVRYRPKDVFSHALKGDILPSAKLVLKVTRRVKKNSEGEVIEEDPNFRTEVLGTAVKTVRFRALADFQYLLPKENKTRSLKEALMKGDVEKIINYKIAEDDDDLDNLRNIPPPLFSSLETPFAYNYRQNSSVVRVRVRQPDGTFKIKLINRTPKSHIEVTTIRFEDDNIPSKSWYNLRELRTDMEKECVAKVGKLFETRPIWTRYALLCVLDKKHHKYIQAALVRHAYVYSSGPWRECWVRYGVDPRKDQKYNIYQNVDIRVFHGEHRPREIRTRRHFGKQANLYQKEDKEDGQTEHDKEAHIFDGVTLKATHAFYQLCDVTDPDLLRLINNPKYLKPICTKYTGFYYLCVHTRIRTIFRKKNLALLNGNIETVDPEKGLEEEIEKELEKSSGKGENDERIEEEEEESGSVSTTDVEKLAKEAYAEISSNKRLKDVVDDYMTELENVGSKMGYEDDDDTDIQEEYEEDIEDDEQEENIEDDLHEEDINREMDE